MLQELNSSSQINKLKMNIFKLIKAIFTKQRLTKDSMLTEDIWLQQETIQAINPKNFIQYSYTYKVCIFKRNSTERLQQWRYLEHF